MKAIIYLLQIISAIIYSSLFAFVISIVTIAPTLWLFDLKFWQMLIVLFIAIEVIISIITFVQTIISIPYYWIIKDNYIAAVISILISLSIYVVAAVTMWKMPFHGFWQTLSYIVASVEMIAVAIVTVVLIWSCAKKDY